MNREAVAVIPRKIRSTAQKTSIKAARKNVCAYPECGITTGLEIDHIVALDLGGTEAEWNLQLLCYDHHKAKTALDAKLSAKGRRIRKREAGEKKPTTLRGLGFDKRFIRSVNGKTRARPPVGGVE